MTEQKPITNIAELMNDYLNKGISAAKIIEVRDDYFREQKEKYRNIRPITTFAEIQQYFKRRFGS